MKKILTKLFIITILFIAIGSVCHYAFGQDGLIGDYLQSVLTPGYGTSTVTSFTNSLVEVVDPGVEFFGELSYCPPSSGEGPYAYSVTVDMFSDYFTVKVEATNDWITSDGSVVTAFGVGGDTLSMYDIQISDLDLPGGIGPIEFDPSHSLGFIVPEVYIREITWDTTLKQVNVRFAWVRNSVTYAFKLQAESGDTDGDGVPDYLDQCPDVFGEEAYEGCPTPQTDRDGDGVPDEVDLCPDVFGLRGRDGCPTPRPSRYSEQDLVVRNVTYSAYAKPGAGWNIPVQWYEFFPHALVENRGFETAERFTVRFLLDNRILASVSVSSLEPGESIWVHPRADMLDRGFHVRPGEYTLRVVCDFFNRIHELDESNNVYQVPLVLRSDD